MEPLSKLARIAVEGRYHRRGRTGFTDPWKNTGDTVGGVGTCRRTAHGSSPIDVKSKSKGSFRNRSTKKQAVLFYEKEPEAFILLCEGLVSMKPTAAWAP